MDACVEIIVTNFHEMLRNNGFNQLPVSAVIKVLKSDKLPVKSEKEAAIAALHWVEVNHEERKQFLQEVFSSVRLTELTPHFIKCSLMKNAHVRQNESCMKTLQEFIDCAAFGFSLGRDIKLSHPRISTGIQQELVILCESFTESGSVADWEIRLARMSNQKLKLRELWRTTQCTRSDHGSTIAIFHNGSGTIQAHGERHKAKSYFGICTNDNNLYLSGYPDSHSMLQTLTPVVRFDPAQNAYFPCSSLPTRRKSHQLVTGIKGTIYAVGGYIYTEADRTPSGQDTYRFTKKSCLDVYEFNTAMNRWSQIGGHSPLRLAVRPFYPCFHFDNKIFILSLHQEIMMFDCDNGEYKEIRIASNADLKAVLQPHAIVSSTKHKDVAIITSFIQCLNQCVPILILHLVRLKEIFERIPVRSSVQGPATEIDFDEIFVVHMPTLAVEGSHVDILGITIFGGDLVAMARSVSDDAFAFLCDADELCFERKKVLRWRKAYQFSTRHMSDEIKVRNIKRVRMHTLVTNVT